MPTKTSKSAKVEKPALAAVPKSDTAAVMPGSPAPKAAKAAQISVVSTDYDVEDDTMDGAAAKGDAVKLKELLAAVTEKTGAKKKDVREVVDAALAEISAALGAGKSLNLLPLGHIRVARTNAKGDAKMMVLKLRVGGGGPKQALAADGEDS